MTTLNYQVSQSSDDAESYLDLDSNVIYNDTANTYAINAAVAPTRTHGYRFQNVAVAQGTTITSASIDFYGSKAGTTDTKTTIYGEDADNSATFSSSSGPHARTKTTATGEISLGPFAFPTPQWFVNFDVTDIVQEIVNRGSWSSGNAMSIILEKNTSAFLQSITCYNYDYSTNVYGMKLEINFTSADTSSINIGDAWKSIDGMQINIGDVWKTVAGAQINIGDAWKTISI